MFQASGGSPNWSPDAKSIVPIAPSARIGPPSARRARQRAFAGPGSAWFAATIGPSGAGPAAAASAAREPAAGGRRDGRRAGEGASSTTSAAHRAVATRPERGKDGDDHDHPEDRHEGGLGRGEAVGDLLGRIAPHLAKRSGQRARW